MLCHLKDIFSLFQKATSMTINEGKSTLTASACTQHEIHFSLNRFQFAQMGLDDGLKYLGYKLKAIEYKIANWTWLIAKLEKRLILWYLKYLSQAG